MSIPAPGESFRRFEILQRVGAGGMGEVYRARDTKLGRDVALKFLTATGEPVGGGERMRREARALAALRHPNIVTIYDFDEVDGISFLVLEWVDGWSLDRQLVGGPCPPSEFFRLALPIAAALAAAHRAGIVHRDLKPANVLLATNGQVKLVDFGLARWKGTETALTREGTVVGTVAYMSPEQARGDEAGPASDVFSFGVLAYELLAGLRPFSGAGAAAVLYSIVNAAPPPLAGQRPDLPGELVSLVERCLNKAAEGRPRDGLELLAELERQRPAGSGPGGARSTAVTAELPSTAADAVEQEIRFCSTADGVGLAYSTIGQGPPLVRVLGWFTHLEVEWQWPELRYLWERLAERFTVIRYDGRGIGLSDPWHEEFTEEARALDLEAVLAATGVDSAALMAISEGGWTAASYAVKHPERVSHLVFYGCYSRGMVARPSYDAEEDEALMTLMRKGWGRRDPTFRQIFTSQFFPPDADRRLVANFNELQRSSADAETAVRYMRSVHHMRRDGKEIFKRVRAPTLVLHCHRDKVSPFEEGRRIAALIPGATFRPLHGTDHYFPLDRASANEVAETITRFVLG